MGGSSEKVTVGYKYYVGMHMALCHGPVDKLVRIRVGGEKAWVGNNTGGALTIDKPDLFGGEKREGGVSGQVDIEMGSPTQGQNSYLAAKLGTDLLPAFRGVCCAVLRQVYVGLNPYLKDWGWMLQRIRVRANGEEQWYKNKAAIGQGYHFLDVIPPWREEVTDSLSSYAITVPPGSEDGVFSVTAYGIRHDPTKQSAGMAKAVWNGTVGRELFSIELSFMLHHKQDGSDSAVILFTDESGVGIPLQFYPHAGQRGNRPTFNGTALVPYSLDVGQWYRLTVIALTPSTVQVTLLLGAAVLSTLIIAGNIAAVKGYWFGLIGGGFANTTSISYGNVVLVSASYFSGEDRLGTCFDMNPAHIIRECLTDGNWGMGYPESEIDDQSFTAAADTLYDEGMGMSILWNQQTSIEDFVGEVLRHIDAALYVDSTTGKFALKLIRGGYNEASLLVLDKSNISRVEGYTKQTLAELANEITVSYNSNETGQVETVTLQNLAMIQQQGAIIPASVEYPGFANAAIISRVAARDLKSISSPLVTATIYANRAAAALNIGDVFKWNWTEEDEGGAVVSTSYIMRVVEIAFGDGVDNTVRIQCAQDVFALPDITYVEAEPTEWVNPSAPPLPASPRLVMETPYYEIVRRLGEVDATAKLTGLQELGYLMVAAGRQAGEINAELQIDSGAGYSEGGALDFCPYSMLDGAIGILDTTAVLKDGADLDEFVAGSLAQIDDEIITIESITDGVATIRRGCLDTVPAAHADGTAVIIWDGYAASDSVEYVDSDELNVKILTVSSGGVLAIAGAPVDSVIMGQRAMRPYPPANVKIGGTYYPPLIVADDLVGIIVTWAHRDRTQQTGGTVLGWTDASVGPETGVTYSARLVRTDTEAEVASEAGISGITATLTPAYRGNVRLELWAERDGLECFQVFAHTFFYVAVAPVYYDSAVVYYDGKEVHYEL